MSVEANTFHNGCLETFGRAGLETGVTSNQPNICYTISKRIQKKYLGKKKISKKGGCDFILTIKGLVNVCINAIPSNCISDRVQDPLELSKRRVLLFLHINNRREKKYNVSRNKGKNIIINMLFVLIECLSGQSEEHQNARIPANGHVQGSRQAGSKEVAGQAGRRRNLLSSI